MWPRTRAQHDYGVVSPCHRWRIQRRIGRVGDKGDPGAAADVVANTSIGNHLLQATTLSIILGAFRQKIDACSWRLQFLDPLLDLVSVRDRNGVSARANRV